MRKKYYYSKDEKIVNCLLALCNWHDTAPESVDLGNWVCGTFACFGGHLAKWAEFQAMGVSVSLFYSSPTIRNFDDEQVFLSPGEVSKHLFGSMLFMRRESDTPYKSVLSDYQIVVQRLENQIAALSPPDHRASSRRRSKFNLSQ